MAQSLFGLSGDKMKGRKAADPVWRLIDTDGNILSSEDYPVNRVLSTKKSLNEFVCGIYRPDEAATIWVLVNAVPVMDAGNNLAQVIAAFVDITDRKRNEDIIKFRLSMIDYSLSHSVPEILQRAIDEICVFFESPIGFFHFVNPDQASLTLQVWSTRTEREFCTAQGSGMHYGFDRVGIWIDCVKVRRPVIHNDYASLPHRKGLPEGHASVARELVTPIIRGDKIVAILGVGNKTNEYTEAEADMLFYLADMAWSIADRKRAEEIIVRQIREKEVLLKEVHHRIKNNISTIASMLYLQSDKIKNQEARSILNDAISRVESMSIIYQKLLMTDDYADLSARVYITELVTAIINIFSDSGRISINYEIDDVRLEVNLLFYIGIIINELVTNSMKYAFKDNESGNINIKLKNGSDEISISLWDNGIGFLPGFDINATSSYGLTIIKILAEQLKGSLRIYNSDGARCELIFKK
jgi:two-component sensor histidine kinase